jgi:general secretion pathway protein D
MTMTERFCLLSLLATASASAQLKPSKILPPPPPRNSPGASPAPAAAPGAPATPPAPGQPPEQSYPGEKEATDCKKYPAGKKFKWELRGEVDLMTMLNTISPMLCRPFIVPSNIPSRKVTILAPSTITSNEAYRMFLSALETMGLTVQPQGKALKIIESNRARESAIPIYGENNEPANQDQYVTRLVRLEHVAPEDVKPVIERLKGRDGDITVYAPTNTIVVTDLASNIKRIEEVLTQLDVALGGEKVYVIPLHTVAATEMAQMLEKIFGVTKPGAQPPRTRLGMGAAKDQSAAGAAAQPAPAGRERGGTISISQIIPDDRNNLLIVVATEKAYQQILALVRRLDQQTAIGDNITDRVHVMALENANAEDVAGTLGGLGAGVSKGGKGGGSAAAPAAGQHGLFEGDVRIASDKPTNSLVIVASGRDYITVRDLIKKLDIPRRQVFVEAVILEISIDKSRKFGIGGHGGGTVGSGTDQSLIYGASIPSSDVNSLVFNPAALTGLAAGLRGPPIPGAATILGLPPGTSIPSFGVFLQAIQNNGDVNVVSMPHILTTDNEKATIQVGQNLPFPGTLGGFPGFGGAPGGATGGAIPGASFGFGTSVQRQDVALKLEITPHVNDSDFVRLEIDNELSDVANENFNGLGPATSKRTVKSVVTIRDQQSIVLGGLIKDRVSEKVSKVPLLGDIPILGYLFKRTEKTILKQNLLIILTPYIVKDPNDLRRIFERKILERKEFMERYSAFQDERDYEAEVDYHRKRGFLEEINQTAIEAEREAAELRAAEEAMHARDISGAVEIGPPPPPPPSRLHPRPPPVPQQ